MRVLQFRYLCDSGGVSSTMLLRAREMERRGIEHEFWFCEPSNRLPEFLATGRATLGPLAGLAERLAKGDVDVLHMPASDPAALLVAHMAGRARVVVTGHGALSDSWHRGNCFGYTAISTGTARLNQPFTDIAIDVVRNAIDTDRYAPPDAPDAGPPIVAFVGRTTAPEKDFPRFTRIARHLVETGMRAWVADPHEGNWEKFAGLPVDRIALERWSAVANADMPRFYRDVAASGGVVLLTSVTEGFGNVATEAAACGARVAAPDQIGFQDSVVPGVTGILFPPKATDADVADEVRAYLAAPHDMSAVSAAAKDIFSPVRMFDGYLAAYQRGPRPAPPAAPVAEDAPELAVLLEHLRLQRTWRARIARRESVQLARRGFRAHALYALWLTARYDPREFLKLVAVQQVAATARGLLRPAAST